jgi:hypothetical protein
MLTDRTDYLSRNPPLKRVVKLPFDYVRLLGDDYAFYLNDALMCSICRTVFSQAQQDFFDAISEPE